MEEGPPCQLEVSGWGDRSGTQPSRPSPAPPEAQPSSTCLSCFLSFIHSFDKHVFVLTVQARLGV